MHQEQLLSRDNEIEHLRLIIAKLKRMMFGRKSEKVAREIEQLELKLEELKTSQAERGAATPVGSPSKNKPTRGPLPEHLPRETHTHLPAEDACPECGGGLRKLGEDVSEILEYVPESFKVIRHLQPKLNCTKCDVIVEAPAPSRPIERGLAGPGLLAHVLVSKYVDHYPLYRQSEIYARQGVDLDRSTLTDWVGAASHLLMPLVDQVRKQVLAATKLHADDTPVPVMAPGRGKTKQRGFGLMCAMIVRLEMMHRPQSGSPIPKIARASIRNGTSLISQASCRPMRTLGSIISMKGAGSLKPHAGRTFGANSMTSTPLLVQR